MTGGSLTVINRSPFQGILTFDNGGFGISAGSPPNFDFLGGSDRTVRPKSSTSYSLELDVESMLSVEYGSDSRPAPRHRASIGNSHHQYLTWKLNSKNLATNGLGGAEDVSALRDQLFESFLDAKSFEAVGSLEHALFDLGECERNRL